jgi:prepilin-type N-terminal cleavage/methylation domain-containing protein
MVTPQQSSARKRPSTLHAFPSPNGFTILEIIIVLFLLAGLLSLIVPRITIGDNLNSVGRRWIAALRSIQDLSVTTQKTVRLSVDLDRGQYWPTVLDGKEEKPPLDAAWAVPLSLPESVRIAEIQNGTVKRSSGKADIFFYPNGRIDPAVMHFEDGSANVLGIRIEPVTGNITVSDQRIDPPPPWTVPDRVKVLLQIQNIPAGAKPSQLGPP